MYEIGKVYATEECNGEITLKNNFRQMNRADQKALIGDLIDDLTVFYQFLDKNEDQSAFDDFFRSLSQNDPTWRKQRGLEQMKIAKPNEQGEDYGNQHE